MIHWIAADVSAGPSLETFDVWHDRAVFHFLTAPGDRAAYKKLLLQMVPAGGHAVCTRWTAKMQWARGSAI